MSERGHRLGWAIVRHLHNEGGLFIWMGGTTLAVVVAFAGWLDRDMASVIALFALFAGCVYGQSVTYWPLDRGRTWSEKEPECEK